MSERKKLLKLSYVKSSFKLISALLYQRCTTQIKKIMPKPRGQNDMFLPFHRVHLSRKQAQVLIKESKPSEIKYQNQCLKDTDLKDRKRVA